MEPKINIFVVVDVIESLSGGTLQNGNLCLMDNSPWGSSNQGTPNLSTLCAPGQVITWTLLALDLQTPAGIKNITFLPPSGSSHPNPPVSSTPADSAKLDVNVWSGIVPYWLVPGLEYRYRLELQMYDGKNSLMYVETPSLKRI